MKITAPLLILLFPLLLFGVHACHSDQPSIRYSIHHHPVTDSTGDKVYFFLSKMAWLPAKGIARFPDGGIPKYLMEEVSLCCLNTRSRELKEIASFDELTAIIGPYRSSWSTRLLHTGSSVYYKAGPAGGFASPGIRVPERMDSLKLQKIIRSCDRWHRYKVHSGEIIGGPKDSLPQGWQQTNTLSITVTDSLLSLVPLYEVGFILQELFPKPDDAYIQDLIYLRNRSALSRKAIAQQIIAPMDQGSIQKVLQEMTKQAARLTGRDSLEYTQRTKETRDYLKTLLEENRD